MLKNRKSVNSTIMQASSQIIQGPFASQPEENEKQKPIDLVELIYSPDWKTILLDLVQSERMDAWNIDIAELAGKYYARIQELTGTNLRVPANAMLCSAILLRFKSKKLKISSIEEAEELLMQEQAEAAKITKLYDNFEPFLKNPRMMREGKISLNDLVSAIEELMEKSKQKALKKRMEMSNFKLPESTVNIEERIGKVYDSILSSVDSTGLCLFSNLVEGKKGFEVVETFIPVLFLCNREKIAAWQDEWFGQIFIQVV